MIEKLHLLPEQLTCSPVELRVNLAAWAAVEAERAEAAKAASKPKKKGKAP